MAQTTEHGQMDDKEEEESSSSSSTTLLFRVDIGSKGRGLFANQTIKPRTLIHTAPCIRIVKDEYDKYMKYTILEHYLFNASNGDKFLALGYGSLFNHSKHPNIDYRIDPINLCIKYSSGHKEISINDELCISYGNNLWFDDASSSASKSCSSSGRTNHDDSSSSTTDDDGRTNDDGIALFLANMEL